MEDWIGAHWDNSSGLTTLGSQMIFLKESVIDRSFGLAFTSSREKVSNSEFPNVFSK